VKDDDMGDFYCIPSNNRDLSYSFTFPRVQGASSLNDYHSHDAERLNVDGVKLLIASPVGTEKIVRKTYR
jgi:UDP-N-acetylglucosamine 4,6-dehydratase